MTSCRARLARAGAGHPRRRRPLRRVEARLPAPRRRVVHSAARLGKGCCRRAPATGTPTRCARARNGSCGSRRKPTHCSSATRSRTATGHPATTATPSPLHGRLANGQVVPMRWHCEDAAMPYSTLPVIRERWHAIVADLRKRHRHLRRLGHVLLHERRLQALGRLPRRDRRRHPRDRTSTTRAGPRGSMRSARSAASPSSSAAP